MTIMTAPTYVAGSTICAMRLRTYSPPNAKPKMNALSMSSNECVELLSTRLSMRIQPNSYMNDAAPVMNAAITNHLANVSWSAEDCAGAVCGDGAGPVCRRTINQTNRASTTFSSPAV